jgi:hypothetical protein
MTVPNAVAVPCDGGVAIVTAVKTPESDVNR